jgi:hypothetical protein
MPWPRALTELRQRRSPCWCACAPWGPSPGSGDPLGLPLGTPWGPSPGSGDPLGLPLGTPWASLWATSSLEPPALASAAQARPRQWPEAPESCPRLCAKPARHCAPPLCSKPARHCRLRRRPSRAAAGGSSRPCRACCAASGAPRPSAAPLVAPPRCRHGALRAPWRSCAARWARCGFMRSWGASWHESAARAARPLRSGR